MTPLAQLVDAILESTAPVTQILDDVDLSFDPPDPDDMRMLLSSILAPLEQLYQPRDLLIATAVLEAVAPMIAETSLLFDPRTARAA
jgi:hypothetical protein